MLQCRWNVYLLTVLQRMLTVYFSHLTLRWKKLKASDTEQGWVIVAFIPCYQQTQYPLFSYTSQTLHYVYRCLLSFPLCKVQTRGGSEWPVTLTHSLYYSVVGCLQSIIRSCCTQMSAWWNQTGDVQLGKAQGKRMKMKRSIVLIHHENRVS